MDEPQSATLGPGAWTPNDAELETEDMGEALSLRIIRFLRLCWGKRRMVFGILAAGIMLSVVYAHLQPNMYTSTTTLMPPDNTSSSSNLMGLLSSVGPAASVGSAALGIKSPGAVFVGILGSQTVKKGVVVRFDLVHHYKKRLVEDACKKLTADTVIREDLKSGIITVNVKADNPVLASNLAQEYVAELNSVVSNNSTSAARRERIFLEERLKEIKKDLDDSGEALSRFSTQSRTVDLPTQAKATVDSGLKLQNELAAARSDIAGLRQAYAEDNVRVRTARARVTELQKQMDKIIGPSTKSGSMATAGGSDYPSLEALPALGLTYADLNRKVLVEEALWEALTKQYEAAKVQEAKEIPIVRVLDVANVPQRRSAPAPGKIVALGAMLSLFFACASVLACSAWEKMDPQDERKKLVAEIVDTTLNSAPWFWRLPGMNWVQARLSGSKQRSISA